MQTITDRPTSCAADDLVILVCGTYAACDADVGNRWWQQDSRPWRELRKRLPAGVRLAGEGEIFHWTGENSGAPGSRRGATCWNTCWSWSPPDAVTIW